MINITIKELMENLLKTYASGIWTGTVISILTLEWPEIYKKIMKKKRKGKTNGHN